MKRTILTTVLALSCLCASAQFRIMSSSTPAEGESWGLDSLTNNMGVGYQLNNKVMLGIQKNGENYDFVGRYSLGDNMYLSAQMPTEDALDNITFGVGVSVKFWKELYVEPNYTRKNEEGSFNVGLSYKL